MKKILRNRHKGETALVIGNGPSLSDVPREFLTMYHSFGTNRIYLLDGFTPTYYVAVDPVAIEPFISDIDNMDCEKFLKSHFTTHLITNAIPLHSSAIPAFSREPDKWIYEGWSVIYVCLQLAFYMGFSTVLLVGVDHNYAEDSANYFDPEYKNGVDGWHAPDLERSERSYHMAKTVYDFDGRKIINLTPGSALDVFEKGRIEEW